MAEHDDDQDAKRQNGAGDDDLPDDPAELKKLLAESRKAQGRMANELKPLKKARAEMSEHLIKWSRLGEKHGLDPDGLDKLLSDREERDLQRAKDTGGEEAQQMIENLKQKHERERAEWQREDARKEALLQGVLVDDRLSAALAKHVDTSKPGLAKGAFALLRHRVKAAPDADAPRGYSPMVAVDGADMPLEEFLAQWADTDPEAEPYLRQSQATGGGATGGAGGRKAKQLYRSTATAKETSDYITDHGLAAWNALPRTPPSGTTR